MSHISPKTNPSAQPFPLDYLISFTLCIVYIEQNQIVYFGGVWKITIDTQILVQFQLQLLAH